MKDKETIYAVSAVRDFAMYKKCIADNPYCRDWSLHPYDNRAENLGIPAIYNRFIDHLPGDGWIVFCHEDWQLLCSLEDALRNYPKDRLYGPVGAFFEEGRKAGFVGIVGSVQESRKDGSHLKQVRGFHRSGTAGTFDCMCLIVHSSLLRQYKMHFDENLLFDMYVEDFCSAAREKFSIASEILPLESRHYSEGVTGQRFEDALSYVQKKYAEATHAYCTTVGYKNIWGIVPIKPTYTARRQLISTIRYLLLK